MAGISAADTVWLMVSTGLVLLMVPGLALFYGGMVQAKNVLSIFVHCLFSLALVTVQWAVVGYSLAFSGSRLGLIGGLDHAFLRGVGLEPHGSVPHLLFASYQGVFAAITPALIAGAFAERMRFSAFAAFVLLWTTLVYDPLAHWSWASDGWLNRLGALDYAGGTVVHLSSGISALVAAAMVGRRVGSSHHPHQPHHLPMTALGAGLLWFGWFGFNGGAGAAADALAALAVVNTLIAPAAGMLGWAAIDGWRHGKVTLLGLVSGAVAGLVGITPAAGYVSPMAAAAIGCMTSGGCFVAVLAKHRAPYDDALDAFGVHGVGGAFGALLTGVFASQAINPHGADGLLLGHGLLLGKQTLGVAAAGIYAGAMTWLLLRVMGRFFRLRVSGEEEREGLDTALHGERAYSNPGGF